MMNNASVLIFVVCSFFTVLGNAEARKDRITNGTFKHLVQSNVASSENQVEHRSLSTTTSAMQCAPEYNY